jgi:hypothetical protein
MQQNPKLEGGESSGCLFLRNGGTKSNYAGSTVTRTQTLPKSADRLSIRKSTFQGRSKSTFGQIIFCDAQQNAADEKLKNMV